MQVHPKSFFNMIYGLLNCTLFLMGAVGTKQFGITIFQFLNKNLPGLFYYIAADYFPGVFFIALNLS